MRQDERTDFINKTNNLSDNELPLVTHDRMIVQSFVILVASCKQICYVN